LRGGIDDRRTGCDERLQVLHDGHALSKSLLGLLVVGNIRPGADKLQRPAAPSPRMTLKVSWIQI
jgi:hypothetical protein